MFYLINTYQYDYNLKLGINDKNLVAVHRDKDSPVFIIKIVYCIARIQAVIDTCGVCKPAIDNSRQDLKTFCYFAYLNIQIIHNMGKAT